MSRHLSFDGSQFVVLLEQFYEQPTVEVAQALLGKYLFLESPQSLKVGRIVETEAYPGIGDRASHSNRGLTSRTKVLFGPAGTVYIYLIYGMYHCLNVVTDTPESGGAVLIRAVSPVQDLEGKTSGPGLVCKSYGIDKSLNASSIVTGPLFIAERKGDVKGKYRAMPRVGVDYAGPDKDKLYRFKIDD